MVGDFPHFTPQETWSFLVRKPMGFSWGNPQILRVDPSWFQAIFRGVPFTPGGWFFVTFCWLEDQRDGKYLRRSYITANIYWLTVLLNQNIYLIIHKILHPGWSLRLRSDPDKAFEHEILPLILSFCRSCVHECLVWNPKIAAVGQESQQEDDLNRKLAMRFAVAFFQWGDSKREHFKKATRALALRFPKEDIIYYFMKIIVCN